MPSRGLNAPFWHILLYPCAYEIGNNKYYLHCSVTVNYSIPWSYIDFPILLNPCITILDLQLLEELNIGGLRADDDNGMSTYC